MGRKTKAQKEAIELEQSVDSERKRLLQIMQDADVYSIILDPLIESYIDTFRIYTLMYNRWADKGFPATAKYENKSGAINNVKHPLSVQVDIWSERKLKALEKLGMTNKALSQKVITGGTTVDTSTGTAEKELDGTNSAVIDFRKKWSK